MEWGKYQGSSVAYARVSPEGWFLKANPACCELLGYSEEELTNLRVRDVTHPDDRPQSVALVERALHLREAPIEIIKRYVRKDGELVWALLETTLKRNEEGEPIHFLSRIDDITGSVRGDPVLRAFSRRVQQIQEQERHRIARELHDQLGQVLSAVRLELGLLAERAGGETQNRAARLTQLLDETVSGVRRVSLGLRPPILDELGLESALDWLLNETFGRTELSWRLLTPSRELSLDWDTRITLFRICQEGINNVLRHAEASQVVVQLEYLENEVRLQVADDGTGVEPRSDPGPPGAMGLLGIRERAVLLGGSVRLRPNSPRGTVLEVVLPLSAADDGRDGLSFQWG